MKTLIIDLTKNPPVIDSYAGEIGENNAVTLEIHTEDYEDVSKYVMLFEVDGGILPSAIFPAADVIEIPLVEALTQKQILTCQLQGMSEDGKSVITKSPIVRLYLDESLTGEIVSDPETGETIFSEIEKIKAILDDKQDILTEANAGKNITIENGVISATGGSDAKEPFYAVFNETPYEDVKQAIIDGRQVYVVYDNMLFSYVGQSRSMPYDIDPDLDSYVFRFVCIDGTIQGNFTSYLVRIKNLRGETGYTIHESDILNDNMLMPYFDDTEYTDEGILTAKAVIDAIDDKIAKALAEIGIAEDGEF